MSDATAAVVAPVATQASAVASDAAQANNDTTTLSAHTPLSNTPSSTSTPASQSTPSSPATAAARKPPPQTPVLPVHPVAHSASASHASTTPQQPQGGLAPTTPLSTATSPSSATNATARPPTVSTPAPANPNSFGAKQAAALSNLTIQQQLRYQQLQLERMRKLRAAQAAAASSGGGHVVGSGGVSSEASPALVGFALPPVPSSASPALAHVRPGDANFHHGVRPRYVVPTARTPSAPVRPQPSPRPPSTPTAIRPSNDTPYIPNPNFYARMGSVPVRQPYSPHTPNTAAKATGAGAKANGSASAAKKAEVKRPLTGSHVPMAQGRQQQHQQQQQQQQQQQHQQQQQQQQQKQQQQTQHQQQTQQQANAKKRAADALEDPRVRKVRQRISAALSTDAKTIQDAASIDTPFESKENAVRRLLSYHLLVPEPTSDEVIRIADREFGEVAAMLIEKSNSLKTKLRDIELRTALHLQAPEEALLIGRLLVEDEKEEISRLTQPPPPPPLSSIDALSMHINGVGMLEPGALDTFFEAALLEGLDPSGTGHVGGIPLDFAGFDVHGGGDLFGDDYDVEGQLERALEMQHQRHLLEMQALKATDGHVVAQQQQHLPPPATPTTPATHVTHVTQGQSVTLKLKAPTTDAPPKIRLTLKGSSQQ